MEAADNKSNVKEAEPIKPVSIKFNFKDLENGEDKKKEFVELLNTLGLSFTEDELLVTLTANNNDSDKLKEVSSFVNDYSKVLRNSFKRTNDESYAQKTKSFEDAVAKLSKFIKDSEEQSNEEE